VTSGDGTGMQFRWANTWRAMRDADYEGLVVAGAGAIGMFGALQFLTGFFATTRGAFGFIRCDATPILFVRSEVERRAVLAEGLVHAEVVALNASGAEYASGAGGCVRDRVGGRIGVVGLECMSGQAEAGLAASLGVATLTDATEVLATARAIKTDHDVEQMRAAAAIAERALRHAIATARTGMTELALAASVEAHARSEGAQLTLVYVSSGEFVGRRAVARRLSPEDVVTVFVELASRTGYWVELGAILAMPHAAGVDAIAGPCIAALEQGARTLGAGTRAARAAAAMQDVLHSSGLSASINLGHGVGIDEEPPLISVESCATIDRTAMIALHPSAGSPGSSTGCAVANTYIVQGGDVEALCELPYAVHEAAG
jgi:Xaa-Pro aminopeptidase